jgi:hypothetical protein
MNTAGVLIETPNNEIFNASVAACALEAERDGDISVSEMFQYLRTPGQNARKGQKALSLFST